MNKRVWHLSYFPMLLSVIIGCVTINIYFPAAALEKAADQIVEETWGKQAPGPEKKKGDKESFLRDWMRVANLRIGVTEAWAEEADINVTTPSIRTLKASIKERSESIKPYMAKGNVGISNQGLLELRSDEGLNLKDKAVLTRLINAENNDREALYLEIAKANNFSSERVIDIKKIFAASWLNNAQAGWWVQGPGGEWSQK